MSVVIIFAYYIANNGTKNKTPNCVVDWPDLYLNTILSDVKTVLDKLKFQEKIEDDIVQEILFSLKRDKIFKKINEGLSQGSKIIILDATVPSLGYGINYYASTHNKTFDLQMAIKDSIRYANSNTQDYAPVLIFAQAIDIDSNFRLSAIMVPCPVTNGVRGLEVDLSKFPK